jgi:hypothetical protein
MNPANLQASKGRQEIACGFGYLAPSLDSVGTGKWVGPSNE